MSHNETIISFIIPTFNRALVVCDAIESVLEQSNPHWELIIVDDGSTDDTVQVIQKYLKDQRIKYLYQKNSGVSVARNTGAKNANGNYYIFLDSDDTLFPKLIDKLHQNKFYHFDLIFWQVSKVLDGKVLKKKPVGLGKMYNNLKATFLAGSVCYKKDIFWNSGGFDPLMTFGENYELGLRVSQIENLKIKYIKEPLLEYVVDTGERISNSFQSRLNSNLYLYEKHKESYENDPRSLATLYYIIAFIFEKTGKKNAALKYYRNSWSNTPWNIKPALKILYLNFFK